MLKAVEDISATKKRLRIEIPSEVIEGEIKTSLDQLRREAKIPGFRPGKAPVTLIEKRFGKEIEGQVLERLIPEQLGHAIKEAGLKPIAMPTLDEEFKFDRHNPISLSVIVEVVPPIEGIDYENITVKDFPVEVEESDVESTLNRLLEEKAVYETVDREIDKDDLVSFEYVDSEIEAGEPVPNVKEIVSKMGNEMFPPDLMEKVIGKKKGDIVEFVESFDENRSRELDGRTIKIKVAVSEVKKKVRPEPDDEFAKDLGFENITELKEKLKERISGAKKVRVKKLQKSQILSKLLEKADFEAPESLVQREMEILAMQKSADSAEDAESAASDAGDDLDAAVTEGIAEKKKVEDPVEKLKQDAIRNVRASLIVETLGHKEGVSVTDQEVQERISLMAKRFSATPEAVRQFYEYQHGSLDGLRQSIFEDKVMDILLSKAVVEKGE